MSQIDIQPNLFTAHKDLQGIYCHLLNGVDLQFGLLFGEIMFPHYRPWIREGKVKENLFKQNKY